MQLRLQVRRDPDGSWLLSGLPQHPACRFQDLSEGLEFAKRECAAAPALIELYVDGFYAAVSQEGGWPHQLCRPGGFGFSLSHRAG